MIESKRSILKNTMLLSMLTLIGRLLGFVREIVFSFFFGNSVMTDAYNVANSLAAVLFNGLFFGVMSAYIPESSNCDKERKNQITSNIMVILSLIVFGGTVLFFIFNNQIIGIFASGFSEIGKSYTKILSKYTVSTCLSLIFVNVATGYLNAEYKFGFGGAYGMITNLLLCMAVPLSVDSPTKLGVGYAVSVTAPVIVGASIMKRNGFSFSFPIKLSESDYRICKNALPAFVGTNIIQLNVLIDKMFASQLKVGTVSALNYADVLSAFIISIIGTTTATVLFTRMSELSADNRHEEFVKVLIDGIKAVSFVLLPCMILVSACSPWIIDLLFHRGQFDVEDVMITADSLKFYAFSIVGTSLNQIMYRAYFSKKDNITPFACYLLGIIVNVVLDYYLIKEYLHVGLAIATSVSVIIIFLIQVLFFFTRVNVHIKLRNIVKSSFGKTLTSACIMGGVSFWLNSFLLEEWSSLTKLKDIKNIVIVSFVGLFLYLFSSLVIGNKEMIAVAKTIKGKMIHT